MNAALRRDADVILRSSLNAVLPDEAVRRALQDLRPGKGRVLLVAAGKAAWQMAHAAVETLGRVDGGVVVTKYGHVKGEIPGVACYEAGHPVPDANGFAATQKALELVQELTAGGYGAVPAFRRRQCAVRAAARSRGRAAGHHEPAAGQRGRHCGDEYHP